MVLAVETLIRLISRILKIEPLIPPHHAVQHGMAVLGETLVRKGNSQRGQHFQHCRVLLYVLCTILEEAAAGELLLGEVIQRLINGCGHILAALVGREGLCGLCSQQDIVEAVRLIVHAFLLQLGGPFGGITELAAALLAGKSLGQKLLPQGVELIGLARVTGGVQVHQHIQPVFVRFHQLRLPQSVHEVVSGKICHVQPHGRHGADSAGDVGCFASLDREIQPVSQHLQVFVIEAAGDSCAGDPQGIDRLGVLLLCRRGKVVLALCYTLNDQLRHGLIRLLRLIRPSVRRGSLYYDGQKHHQRQQCGE